MIAAKSAQSMLRESRMRCDLVAAGPYTPIVIERYSLIGGERGFMLGYPSTTANGNTCMVWGMRKATGGQS